MYVSQNDIAYKAEIRREFEREAEQYRRVQVNKETASHQDEIQQPSLPARVIAFVRNTIKLPIRQPSSQAMPQKSLSGNQ
ncbi:MAG TPA: hypothetical protein VJZ27_06090 [Aggregatilineales bacterium]|nr:hypothetical protein [Aggregatilineales bacterium]